MSFTYVLICTHTFDYSPVFNILLVAFDDFHFP